MKRTRALQVDETERRPASSRHARAAHWGCRGRGVRRGGALAIEGVRGVAVSESGIVVIVSVSFFYR
eukprot:SAG11_NODE_323_length_10745_cov_18.203926_6_plen_67_part_00